MELGPDSSLPISHENLTHSRNDLVTDTASGDRQKDRNTSNTVFLHIIMSQNRRRTFVAVFSFYLNISLHGG